MAYQPNEQRIWQKPTAKTNLFGSHPVSENRPYSKKLAKTAGIQTGPY
jgi:hypothetical protein